MSDSAVSARTYRSPFRFHRERERLLAEAHARPFTPLVSPTLCTRISALSGEDDDRAHMVALCRRFGAAEPGPVTRWCTLDAGSWGLRWERHTEISTWTFYRPLSEDFIPTIDETALDLAPQDWLTNLPGEVLAAAHIDLLRQRRAMPVAPEELIASEVADGLMQVFTDFRAGPDSFIRIQLVQPGGDAALAGRVVQVLFEIETYRMLALLAFPLAGEAGPTLTRLEAEVAAADREVIKPGNIDADRVLLNQLASLAGEAQALSGNTSFRFSASRAYYGLVQERIQQLRERRLDGRPTIADFMGRRLAPAMRTCAAVSERLQGVIEHISTTSQLLNTRVDVAAETTNAGLLASMDRRAKLQLRLQQTVEGLSVVAISYYALALLGYVFKTASALWKHLDPSVATGISAPLVVGVVWLLLHRARKRLLLEERKTGPANRG